MASPCVIVHSGRAASRSGTRVEPDPSPVGGGALPRTPRCRPPRPLRPQRPDPGPTGTRGSGACTDTEPPLVARYPVARGCEASPPELHKLHRPRPPLARGRCRVVAPELPAPPHPAADVEVVVEQYPCEDAPIPALSHPREQGDPGISVRVISHDGAALQTTAAHVVETIGHVDT